jgi:hypothetical protein
VDDVVNADCVCAGTVVYDCPDLQANIGDACDDGNAATTMDSVTVECTCEGVLTSGIVDPASARTFLALQPNPSRDGLVLLKVDGLPREVVQATIVVRDAQGRTLLHTSSTVMAGALRYRLDLSGRAAEGLYMVEVIAGDQHYLGRLVIQ